MVKRFFQKPHTQKMTSAKTSGFQRIQSSLSLRWRCVRHGISVCRMCLKRQTTHPLCFPCNLNYKHLNPSVQNFVLILAVPSLKKRKKVSHRGRKEIKKSYRMTSIFPFPPPPCMNNNKLLSSDLFGFENADVVVIHVPSKPLECLW